MASKGTSPVSDNGSIPPNTHFLQVNEIRSATDSDFEYFMRLAEEEDGWLKKLDKNGITIWQKETGESPIKMAKALGELPVEAGVAFDALLDGEYRSTWDGNVIDDYEYCRLDDCNDIGYYSMKCPGPLRNRDFVNQRSWRIFSEDKFVIFNHSVSIKDLPPSKQFIRGISYITGFLIKSSPNGCPLHYVTQSDPKGKIPSWIINLTINKIAPSVFKKLSGAVSSYSQWKSTHEPEHKPWRFPEQNKLKVMNPAELSQDMVDAASQEEVPEEDLPEDDDKMKELADSIAQKIELDASSNTAADEALGTEVTANGNHLES